MLFAKEYDSFENFHRKAKRELHWGDLNACKPQGFFQCGVFWLQALYYIGVGSINNLGLAHMQCV